MITRLYPIIRTAYNIFCFNRIYIINHFYYFYKYYKYDYGNSILQF